MPAWIAGIQARKDAAADIHVNLDSSTPCWNDAIEGALLELTEAPPPRIFKGVFHQMLNVVGRFGKPRKLLYHGNRKSENPKQFVLDHYQIIIHV